MKICLIGFIFSLVILASGRSQAQASASAPVSTLHGVWVNNDGVRFFKNDRKVEAYSRFAQSLGEMPFSAGVHFNLATTYLFNKEFEKATQEYAEAIKLTEPPVENKRSASQTQLKFAALFNSAIAATELKQIDKALSYYQGCLEITPESVEVKTNIELLVQSQGDGGDKDDKDKDKNKDKKNQGDKPEGQQPKDQKPQPGQQDQPKNQPKPFKSDELSQQDVGRIMEEIKRQEEQVRAKYQNEKRRDVPLDKDW